MHLHRLLFLTKVIHCLILLKIHLSAISSSVLMPENGTNWQEGRTYKHLSDGTELSLDLNTLLASGHFFDSSARTAVRNPQGLCLLTQYRTSMWAVCSTILQNHKTVTSSNNIYNNVPLQTSFVNNAQRYSDQFYPDLSEIRAAVITTLYMLAGLCKLNYMIRWKTGILGI